MLDELVWMALLNKAKKGGQSVEVLNNVPIVPDFSNGDYPVTVEDGYAVKSATVKKPETLIPENIAEGIDVAGIVGALSIPAPALPTLFAKPTTITGFGPDSNYGGLYYKGFNFPESGYGGQLAESFSLIVGDTYTVEWDGTEYSVAAQDASAIMPGTAVLGNAAMLGLNGNNEPFAIAVSNGTGVGFYSLTSTEPTHTVGIYPAAAAESGGSGGTLVAKTGTFTAPNTNPYVIQHNLGVVPVAFSVSVRNPTSAGMVGDSKVYSAFAVSKEVCDLLGISGFANYIHNSSYSPNVRAWSYNPSGVYLDQQDNPSDAVLNSATESEITFGSSGYKPASGAEYRWVAIGIK